VEEINITSDINVVKGDKQKHIDFIKQQASMLVPNVTWYYENFLQLFDQETHLTLVLEKKEKPIAFCSFILSNPVADVDLTATKAEFQNQGYASLIFKTAIYELKEKQFESIILEVAENNLPAQNFYKKLGFTKQVRVLQNYYNDGDNALIYMLKL
jgi:ribosomal protein S18 acetylase RimI-like enzyme